MLAITTDQAAKHRRKRIPEPVVEIHDIPAGVDNVVDIDLERAIARLTRRQQIAVSLYYFLGLPISDIAAVMDCSEGTVKSTLRDVRAKLHSILGEDYR